MKELFRAIKLAKPFWHIFLMLAISIVVISAGKQVAPLVSKNIIDSIQNSIAIGEPLLISVEKIAPYLIAYLISLLLLTAANRFSWRSSQIVTTKLEKHFMDIGYEKLLNSDISFFDRQVSGSLMSKLQRGVNRIIRQVTTSVIYFLPNILTSVFAIGILLSIRPEIVGILFATVIPYVLINLYILKKHVPLEKEYNKTMDKGFGHFYEVISSIRLVKSFVRSDYEQNKMQKYNDKLVAIAKRIERIWDLSLLKDVILELMGGIIFIYTIILVIQGEITLGTFFLIIQYLTILKEPFWNLGWMYFEVRKGLIGARDYFKILDNKSNIVDDKSSVSMKEVKGKIEFRNVYFTYPGNTKTSKNQAVLKNLCLKINPGESIALVAKSGGGKTTIANLINRFYDVDKGSIEIDGTDIRKIKQAELRNNIGIVLQESYLFEQTIEKNLKYGKSYTKESEIIDACKVANAWEFIEKLPKGLRTKIGERGIKLSGGQKQRLSIARTLIKNPPILILDEATSSLDSKSEMKVQDALWKLIKGRTTVIIAHRLSTIQRADRILVIENGKIVEEGSHKELLKQKGVYSCLYDIQSGKKLLEEYELR
ncbi:ABC transporter ATP-binding protein [Candidatus Dojkabacteria bacterium]|nr:ABC transporter ATP-binding protein [Candidatus Dojkabacteria bacterium]